VVSLPTLILKVYKVEQLKWIRVASCLFHKCAYQAVLHKMTSSQEYADQQRMSTDFNNRTSFPNINNNPSSTSVADYVSSSPIVRASSGTTADQRSDFVDYRGAGGGSVTAPVMAVGVTPSFKSPKLESRVAGSGGTSAKKAQKTSHHSFTTTSTTGKWRQKTPDVGTAAGGGRSQASDSVR